ncbi:SDR family NAD(P)-dependent oxidoreductase [Noviherbaspirillum sedimenti]|uniref:SDR family NAD(P)-dependent oxidoreductase n=1 Tax=Noviherbaspirillum sedimenti TaxID=2320865 RepID=A0A3A3FYB6_9BURK|nr:SDR family NAD(P)-dependent oxidoreductase [Noviherbaspirillum sedimenti]RJG00611.1 SDR family NAD(P)-dependent oxidoreductase [Noviherbaspirillum sedimenti]
MKIESGQVAVITGAASGIGLAMARAFGGRGLKLAMADVDEKRLAHEVETLRVAGIEAKAFACDVSLPAELEKLKDGTLAEFGRFDIVCNNAGVILPFSPLWEVSTSDWEWILDINLRGIFNGIRTFVPHLVQQGSGHIVNTASMAGVTMIPGNGAYNATKHAAVSLTETLAADLSEAGSAVGATVLCCGLVSTRIRESVLKRSAPAPINMEAIVNPIAKSFISLPPDDVADMVLDAIEKRRLYLFTNPGSEERIRNRIDRLLSDLH